MSCEKCDEVVTGDVATEVINEWNEKQTDQSSK